MILDPDERTEMDLEYANKESVDIKPNATFRAIRDKIATVQMTYAEVAKAINAPEAEQKFYDGQWHGIPEDAAYTLFYEIAKEDSPIVKEIKILVSGIAKSKPRVWWHDEDTVHVGRTELGWIVFQDIVQPFNDTVGRIEKAVIGSSGTCHTSAFRKMNGKFTEIGRLALNPVCETIEDLRDYWKTLASGNFEFPENMKDMKKAERMELDSEFVKKSIDDSVRSVIEAISEYEPWLREAILRQALAETREVKTRPLTDAYNRLSPFPKLTRTRSINPDIFDGNLVD